VFSNIICCASSIGFSKWNGLAVADYNCTFDNGLDYDEEIVPGDGSVFADALFVNPEEHNYRLSVNSPCINAGDPDPSYNDPDGSRNDIGAIPFTGPSLSSRDPSHSTICGTWLRSLTLSLANPRSRVTIIRTRGWSQSVN